MSESSARCTAIERSGDRNTAAPSTGERKCTPASVILRSSAKLNTWKPPEIGQDRSLPVHEAMQTTVGCNHLRAGPEHKVVGIAEHDLRAQTLELLGRHRLDRPIGTHRHED